MEDASGNNKCVLPLYGICDGNCDAHDFDQYSDQSSNCCEPQTFRCDRNEALTNNACAEGYKATTERCGEDCDTKFETVTELKDLGSGPYVSRTPSECCAIDADVHFIPCKMYMVL